MLEKMIKKLNKNNWKKHPVIEVKGIVSDEDAVVLFDAGYSVGLAHAKTTDVFRNGYFSEYFNSIH